jgi:hypothetical protein
MWLLYVSCAWVAGVILGSKLSLPLLTLLSGLIPLALIPFLPGSKKTLIVAGYVSLLSSAVDFTSRQACLKQMSIPYTSTTTREL